MLIMVVRHGETDWNKKYLIQGRLDVPLNEVGRKQAEELREKIKGLQIDLAFSSPLKRALETANIVLKGRHLPVALDQRILEESYGKMEGKPRTGEEYLRQRQNFATRYPEGESYFDVAARIYSFFDEIIEKFPDKEVIVFTHGGVSRVINSYFCDMANDEFVKYALGNCELKIYQIDR